MAKQADVLMLLGRAFHKVAAATTNELFPAFTIVRTTVNKLLFAERNALAGLYGHTRSDSIHNNVRNLKVATSSTLKW